MSARGDFSGHAEPAEDAASRMDRILAQMGVYVVGGIKPAEPTPWYLWPCNLRIWSIWCRLQTQWVVGGMGGSVIGLNYSAVWATLEGLSVRRRREVFEALQEMERAALDVWREQEQRRAR